MSSRVTQLLLCIIALLLALHLAVLLGFASRPIQGSAEVQDVLRARLIELLTTDGRVVAQLHTDADGGANLRLRSGTGEVRVKLGASRDGSGLILMSGSTEPALWLSAASAGTTLTLAERGKQSRVLTP
jgi:hypothetical protein